jgi:hypothetical protein
MLSSKQSCPLVPRFKRKDGEHQPFVLRKEVIGALKRLGYLDIPKRKKRS